MPRYFLVSCVAFVVDYFLALFLLFLGFSSETSIIGAWLTGSSIGYLGLELWAFKGQKTAVSLKRFGGYFIGICIICAVRIAFFKIWEKMVPASSLYNAVGLIAAYGLAFVAGYLVQSRIIFKINKQD